MSIITHFGGGAGGGSSLLIKEYSQLPESGKENEIAVITDVPVVDYLISPENPYSTTEDLIAEFTPAAGYFNSSGGISSADGTKREVYIAEYIPVEYDHTYKIEYHLSESKSMWMGIVEYADGTFVKRVRPIIDVTGEDATLSYTPSNETITDIRISWRSFGITYTVTFETINVAEDGTPDGMLWICSGASSPSAIWADKKQTVQINPQYAQQCIDGKWVNVDAYCYKDAQWISAISYLYNNANEMDAITGGWMGQGISCVSGDRGGRMPTFAGAYGEKTGLMGIHVTGNVDGYGCVYRTTNKIDLTEYKTLHTIVSVTHATDATTGTIRLAAWTEMTGPVNTTDVASLLALTKMTEGRVSMDISELIGEYYVGFSLYHWGSGDPDPSIVLFQMRLE